jgi:hypothetical protein
MYLPGAVTSGSERSVLTTVRGREAALSPFVELHRIHGSDSAAPELRIAAFRLGQSAAAASKAAQDHKMDSCERDRDAESKKAALMMLP